ncbi:MAG TPA: hypothetical protein VII42_00915 [Caulobacteraceae bacterium]|jgi:hypothetical protein
MTIDHGPEGKNMRTTIIAITLAFAGANASVASQPPPSTQASVIGFMGAQLGMGLAEWKALAYPGRNPAQVTTTCSDDTTRTGGPPVAGGGSGQGGRLVVCTYTNRLGGAALPLSFPLTQAYLVQGPKYDFIDGKLSKVEFQTSIDAFDDLTARFEARYGPAAQTLRDDVTTRGGFDLPRVRKIWRLPKGSVEIIDPATPPTQLAVQFSGR